MSKYNNRHSSSNNSSKWHGPQYNIHHRLPKSRGGRSDPSNLSRVPVEHHNAFNMLFGSNPTAHEVAYVLSSIWIDPMYEIIVILRGDPDTG